MTKTTTAMIADAKKKNIGRRKEKTLYKITIGMHTPKDAFDTFKKAFLMMCYFINRSTQMRKKTVKQLRISCWIKEQSAKSFSSIIYLDKAMEMAEEEGIMIPMNPPDEGEKFRIVVDGKLKSGRHASFPEAFLNLCYEVAQKYPKGKLTADVIISSWIISPPREKYNRIVYLDEAIKSAKNFGIPSPFSKPDKI